MIGWNQAITERNVEGVQKVAEHFATIAEKNVLANSDKAAMRFNCFFSYSYALWLMNSKRIYAPSQVLVSMLLNTDLPPFKVGEINYVFDAFAVQLEKPLVAKSGFEHSHIIFCVEPDGIAIVSINAKMFDLYTPLAKGELEKLNARRKDRGLPTDKRREFAKQIDENLFVWQEEGSDLIKHYTFTTPPSMTYPECIADFPEADTDGWLDLLRLIIGLNLYLQSDKRNVGTPEKHLEKQSDDPEDKIFEEIGIVDMKLSKDEEWQKVMDAVTGIGPPLVGVHIRTGHWRRYLPGVLKNYPNGLDKWIKPALVHGTGTIDVKTNFMGKIQPVGSSLALPVPDIS